MNHYHLCAIQIQHVQSFLFDALQSHEQQKQTDKQTLRKIWSTSKDISCGFKEEIETLLNELIVATRFPSGNSYKLLPSGSGMVLFVVKSNDPESIETKVSEKVWSFFKEQYLKHKGLMSVSYAHVSLNQGNYTKQNDGILLLESAALEIKEVKAKLQGTNTMNRIIASFRKTLFEFKKVDSDQPEEPALKPINYSKSSNGNAFKYLTSYCDNSLRPKSDDGDNRYYIAFLKADLDGMGQAFASVQRLSAYESMSNILNKWISFEGIGTVVNELNDNGQESDAKQAQQPNEDFDLLKCCPVYAAGDDIFCAFRVNDIAKGVAVYQTLLDQINNNLMNDGIEVHLKMRIGIDVTWATQPIRYYYQRADSLMDDCKEHEVPKVLENNGCIRIRINNSTFYAYNSIHWETANKKLVNAYANFPKERETLRENQLLPYKDIVEKEKAGLTLSPEEEAMFEYYCREANFQGKDYQDKLTKLKNETSSHTAGYSNKGVITPYEQEKGNIESLDLWNHLLSDVAILVKLQSEESEEGFVNNHLFNILQILESDKHDASLKNSKDHIKLKNKLLYAALPVAIRHIGRLSEDNPEFSSLALKRLEEELLVWHMLVRKFYRIDVTQISKPPVWNLDKEEEKARTIAYIKLLLTFVSPRFDVTVNAVGNEAYLHAIKTAKEDINKYFDAALRMLNEEYLEKTPALPLEEEKSQASMWRIFVNTYNRKQKNNKGEATEFATFPHISKSMLFRIKQLIEKFGKSKPSIVYSKSMSMISNTRTLLDTEDENTQEQYYSASDESDTELKRQKDNRQRRKEAFPLPSATASEEEIKQFCNSNFIDSVIVFYSYFEAQKKYCTIFGTKRNPK